MTAEPAPRPDGQRRRKARDAALILPLGGAILLMPPVAWIFARPETVLGVPLVVAYVFAVWAFLIASARLIARRLSGTETR